MEYLLSPPCLAWNSRYRVVLRLAWATQGLYWPGYPSKTAGALAPEELPRCLSVRVGQSKVPLPQPVLHGGQARQLGLRPRFSIDISDQILLKPNRQMEVELVWLHTPLEDHATPLLEVVNSGSCSPLVNYCINMPLVQVTLDRLQTVSQFARDFSRAVAGQSLELNNNNVDFIDLPIGVSQLPHQLCHCYDFCLSKEKVLSIDSTLEMLKKNLSSHNDLLCDDWVPVTLLCPLSLTKIEMPIRGVNCNHLQCYDLSSYLTINKRRPRWSCPICSCPAPFRDLRRDDLFLRLLTDPALGDAVHLHVDAQGRWHRAVDDESGRSPPDGDSAGRGGRGGGGDDFEGEVYQSCAVVVDTDDEDGDDSYNLEVVPSAPPVLVSSVPPPVPSPVRSATSSGGFVVDLTGSSSDEEDEQEGQREPTSPSLPPYQQRLPIIGYLSSTDLPLWWLPSVGQQQLHPIALVPVADTFTTQSIVGPRTAATVTCHTHCRPATGSAPAIVSAFSAMPVGLPNWQAIFPPSYALASTSGPSVKTVAVLQR